MIWTTKLYQGLYYLTNHVDPNTLSTSRPKLNYINTCNLLNLRLGHPSGHINKMFPLENFSKTDLPCDSCFMGKQKRLPFNSI